MLESITVADTTPFVGQQPMLKASTLNYVFGANGVGKTTISRILANPDMYLSCRLTWQGAQPFETLVLNRDFVDANFGQLKGIFTLGEKQKGAEEDIRKAHDAVETEKTKRERLRQTLQGEDGDGGKKAELADLQQKFKDACWQKKKGSSRISGTR